MECDENGGERTVPAAKSGRGFKRKRRADSKSSVQLALTFAVPSTSCARSMHVNLVPDCAQNQPHSITYIKPTNYPFMNNMDEISYWIFTKRAPCLLNYDNIIKTQVEQAQSSKTKPVTAKSATDLIIPQVSPNKKRKLKLIDEDSVSTEKQQNIYFDTSQNQNEKTAPSSCKSDTIVSEIGFNIKNTSAQSKAKRMKLQKDFQNIHKKNKIVTSTPKVNLRRSLRKAQQNNNNNSHLNNSFEIFDTSIINGKKEHAQRTLKKSEKIISDHNQNKQKMLEKEKIELNGNFEDFSDVSGFTANYIRSTKLHASKTPRKLRSRNRSDIKNTKRSVQNDKMIVCVNKSNNTELSVPAALNCSTDSSQNVINLVTLKNNVRSTRVNKSTSLLKFVETNDNRNISNNKIPKQEGRNNLNVSFQSRSSGVSRYPKRHKNNTSGNPDQTCSSVNISNTNSPSKRYNMRRGKSNYMKQNKDPDEKVVSKTRSGRKVAVKLNLDNSACSMLNKNDSSEHQSTNVAINVVHPNDSIKNNNTTSRCLRSRRVKTEQLFKDTTSDGSERKDVDGTHSTLVQSIPKCVKRVKKSIDKIGQSLSRVSLRDKSGFAACFSDSDNESEPLKQQKFFC